MPRLGLAGARAPSKWRVGMAERAGNLSQPGQPDLRVVVVFCSFTPWF